MITTTQFYTILTQILPYLYFEVENQTEKNIRDRGGRTEVTQLYTPLNFSLSNRP